MQSAKTISRMLLIGAIALVASSCSKKIHNHVTTGGSNTTTVVPTTTASEATVSMVNATRSGLEQVTGKMNLTLKYASNSISVDGSLKMKRNDVIQMSLQILGMIEVGRIELTNDYVLIVDRHNHRYVKASYDEIPYLKENGISFYTFQSLFWDELFALGEKDNEPSHKSFTEQFGEQTTRLTNAKRNIVLDFIVSATTGVVQQTNIQPSAGSSSLAWTYRNWTKVDGKSFPSDMELKASVGSTDYKAIFKLGKLSTKEKWTETRTNVNTKKYQQISLQQALMQIMSLAN